MGAASELSVVYILLPLYIEIVTPKMMEIGGGVFGRWLGQKGRALMNGISTLIK
jgi:hypothetical protein